MPNYLERLGVHRNLIDSFTDEKSLKKILSQIFNAQALNIHPDKNPRDPQAGDKFDSLRQAWNSINAMNIVEIREHASQRSEHAGAMQLSQLEREFDQKKIDLLDNQVQRLTAQNQESERKNTELTDTIHALNERIIEEHVIYASSGIKDIYKGHEYFTPEYIANRFWLKLNQKSDANSQYAKTNYTYFYLDDRLRPVIVRETDKGSLEPYQSTRFLFTGTNSKIFFKGSLEFSVFEKLNMNIFDKVWTVNDMKQFLPYLHPIIALDRHLVFVWIKIDEKKPIVPSALNYYIAAPLCEMIPMR